MPTIKFDHLEMTVTDVERLESFYTRALNMRIEVSGQIKTLSLGQQKIYLRPLSSKVTTPHAHCLTPGSLTFSLLTDEPLDSLKKRLQDLNIPITENLSEKTTSIYLHDPEGNLIEIIVPRIKTSKVTSNDLISTSYVLYYIGAFLTFLAMGWLLDLIVTRFGSPGLLITTSVYALIFTLVGTYFWHKKQAKMAGGIFITLAVLLVPGIIYAIEKLFGIIAESETTSIDFYSLISQGWLLIEGGTVVAGLIALHFFRFPFLTIPLYIALCFLFQDSVVLFIGADNSFIREWSSIWFGVGILIVAYIMDRRLHPDFAFWGYLFGGLCAWLSFSYISLFSELKLFIYCLTNLLFILLSILLQRKIFLILGSIGFFGYLISLFFRLFHQTVLFPLFFIGFGIGLIIFGVFYQKRHHRIKEKLFSVIPLNIQHWFYPFKKP